MSFTKTKAYNIALSALLLSRQVSDTETDTTTNEVKILNQFWEDALAQTLEQLDLDSLSESITLELLATLDEGPWTYVYKYPSRCTFLRRIKSLSITDNSSTHIPKRVAQYNGQKVIFTNEYQADIECITKDVPLQSLNSSAGFAVAYKLAFLAAPLLVGKGAKTLRQEIYQTYIAFLTDAQDLDERENFSYDSEYDRSEYVRTRLE